MDKRLEQIRERQKESWNRFSFGWKKWNDLVMDFLNPMSNEIIHLLKLKGNELVLDVACGTGEPGLTIASKLRGGKVFITDLAEDMLAIAAENAVHRGILNVQTRVCDGCELPFAANTFDAISCRLGFMFFPDMLLAAKEMIRVLKPGGKMAVSVWNVAEKNFWITAMMGAINKNMELPASILGAPGMFRCAKEGLMSGLFLQAGLRNVSVTEVSGRLDCKTSDVYWNLMTDVAPAVVEALSNANDAIKEKIRRQVYQAVNQKYPDGNILIDSSARVIYGQK